MKVDEETGVRTVPGIQALASRSGQASPSGTVQEKEKVAMAAPNDNSLDAFLNDIREMVNETPGKN